MASEGTLEDPATVFRLPSTFSSSSASSRRAFCRAPLPEETWRALLGGPDGSRGMAPAAAAPFALLGGLSSTAGRGSGGCGGYLEALVPRRRLLEDRLWLQQVR